MPMLARFPPHTLYGLALGIAVGLLGILATLFPPLQEISANADLNWWSAARRALNVGVAQEGVSALPQFAAFVLFLSWGSVLTQLFRTLPTATAWFGALLVCAVYFAGGYLLFVGAGVWIPLFIPLLVQAPFAVFGVILWRHWDESGKQRRVRDALGQYLPAGAVDDMVGDIARLRATQHLVYGVCLATDAVPDVALSERMSPPVVSKFMSQYFSSLFAPVRRRHGCVSDVHNNSMLALWTSLDAPNAQQRKAVCLTALDIVYAAEQFSRSAPVPMPTSIGVHAGELLQGSVGAQAHYQYRSVGEVVTVSTHLQTLNKTLGTRVLVSRATLQGVDGLQVRELGDFMLASHAGPIGVCELLGESAATEEPVRDLCARFASARQQFSAREFSAAERQFMALVEKFPGDGPAQFFAARCREFQLFAPPAPWNGVLSVSGK
jgi:adenylate cyclase